MNEEKRLLLLTQKNAAETILSGGPATPVGTLATVLQM